MVPSQALAWTGVADQLEIAGQREASLAERERANAVVGSR